MVALAGTAMSFSHSSGDEAERWLRTLRLHGRVGAAMQALGVGEAPLMSVSAVDGNASGEPAHGRGVVDDVTRRAGVFAAGRGADCVATVDLLFAVLEVYGPLFERALYLRGATREELIERLSSGEHAVETSRSG